MPSKCRVQPGSSTRGTLPSKPIYGGTVERLVSVNKYDLVWCALLELRRHAPQAGLRWSLHGRSRIAIDFGTQHLTMLEYVNLFFV